MISFKQFISESEHPEWIKKQEHFYHGSPSKNLESIKKNGLKVGK